MKKEYCKVYRKKCMDSFCSKNNDHENCKFRVDKESFRRSKVIYVAGKYTGDIDANIKVAREYAIKVWEMGFTAITPHLNNIHFEEDCNLGYEDYMNGDFEIISRCDAVFLLPGWEDSKGAIREHRFAIENSIDVFYTLKDLEKLDVSEES